MRVILGITIFCFALGVVGGCFARKWRIAAASLTAGLIFIVTYLACWVQVGYPSKTVGSPYRYRMDAITEALAKYVEIHKEYPHSLSDLRHEQSSGGLPFTDSGELLDWWDHPFSYRRTPEGFELASLGRDGQIGGVGLDADIFLRDGVLSKEARMPLSQFLFETDSGTSVFITALIASLLAGGLWYGTNKAPERSRASLIASFVVTMAAACFIAANLAAFHVLAQHSGH